jgi:nucleotide-binding universal stress UspA family protein
MFNHIMVAMDSSAYSREALPAAIELAGKFGSEVLVFHVSEHDRGGSVVFTLETPAGATALVADAVEALRKLEVTARGQVRDVAAGHVAKAIVEAADENGIDLIVMGSRGLSDVQGLLLGSVTHKVMQSATIPVLVVRPPKRKVSATNGAVTNSRA